MKKTIKSLLLVTVVFTMMLNAFGLVSMAAHPATGVVTIEAVDEAQNAYKLVLSAKSESDLVLSDFGPVTMIFSYDATKVTAVDSYDPTLVVAPETEDFQYSLANCSATVDRRNNPAQFTNAGVVSKYNADQSRVVVKWDQMAPTSNQPKFPAGTKEAVLGEFYFVIEGGLDALTADTIKFESDHDAEDSMIRLVILTDAALATDSASIAFNKNGQYYPVSNSDLHTLDVDLAYLPKASDDVPMSNDVYVNDAEATLEENGVEFEATQNLIGAGVKATFDLSKYTDYTLKNMIWALATDAGRKYTEAIAFDGIAVGNAVELAATFSNGTKDGAIEQRTITGVDAIFKLINAENAELVVFTNSDADAANEAE